MENELLLKAIENLLDKKLDEKLKPLNERLDRIESTQNTIMTFIEQTDKAFTKLDETVKTVEKLKKAMND